MARYVLTDEETIFLSNQREVRKTVMEVQPVTAILQCTFFILQGGCGEGRRGIPHPSHEPNSPSPKTKKRERKKSNVQTEAAAAAEVDTPAVLLRCG